MFRYFNSLISDSELESVFWELSGIRTDSIESTLTREVVMDRTKRYIKASLKNFRKNKNGEYKPEVTNKMVVEVDFTGIGGEHDKPHPAIVWDSDPNRDNILVIPTTSLKEDKKLYNHYFSIGKIDFLMKDTVVMLDQAVSVSHKRIISETYIDPATGKRTILYINNQQEQRIRDGIRASYLNEKTLYWYLLNNFRKFIPIMENETVQFDHLLRPFRIISNDPEKLIYSLVDEPQTKYKVFWKNSNVSKSKRDKLLQDWCGALGEHYRDPSTRKRLGIKTLRSANTAIAYSNLVAAVAR